MKTFVAIGFGMLTLTALLLLGQNSFAQNKAKATANSLNSKPDDFGKMTLGFQPDKNAYVQAEPMGLTFTFSNGVDRELNTFVPAFAQETEFFVSSADGTLKYRYPTNVTGTAIRFPVRFVPGASVNDTRTLPPQFTDMIFAKPGEYSVQVLLHSANGQEIIRSNTVVIGINEPKGLDKAAFSYLRSHGKQFESSVWMFDNADDLRVLEVFVNEYEKSVYGESAVLALAYNYLAKGENEKARVQFLKLTTSADPSVAAEARDAIANLEKKKG